MLNIIPHTAGKLQSHYSLAEEKYPGFSQMRAALAEKWSRTQ
jgi:hypothetical protein